MFEDQAHAREVTPEVSVLTGDGGSTLPPGAIQVLGNADGDGMDIE